MDVAINGVDISAESNAIDVSNSTANIAVENTNIDSNQTAVAIDDSTVTLGLTDSTLEGKNGLYLDNSDVEVDYNGKNLISGKNSGVYMGGETVLSLYGDETATTEEMKTYETTGEIDKLSGDVLKITSTGSSDSEIGYGIEMKEDGDKTLNVEGGATLVDGNDRINISVSPFTGDVTFNIGDLDSEYTSAQERVTTEKENYSTIFSASGDFSGSGRATHGGFYIVNDGVANLNVLDTYFRADNTGFDGVYAGYGDGELNNGLFINVTDSYFSASNNKKIGVSYAYHNLTTETFNIADSIVYLDENGYRGTNAGYHTYNHSTITASGNNGVGIMAFTFDVTDSYVSANDNSSYGIWLMGDAGESGEAIIYSKFTDSYIETNHNGGEGFYFSSGWRSLQDKGELTFDHSKLVCSGNGFDGLFNRYNTYFVNDSVLSAIANGDSGIYTYGNLILDNSQLYSLWNTESNLSLRHGTPKIDDIYLDGTYIQLDNSFSVFDESAFNAGVINAGVWEKYIFPYYDNQDAAKQNVVAVTEDNYLLITGGSMYLDINKSTAHPKNGIDGEELDLIVLDQDENHRHFNVVSDGVYNVGTNGVYGDFHTIYEYISRLYDNDDQKIYAWVPTAEVHYWVDLDGDGTYTQDEYVTSNVIRGTSLALMVGSGTLDDDMQFAANNPYIPADAYFGEIPDGFYLIWYDAATGEERTIFGIAGQAPSYLIYGDTDVYAELTANPVDPDPDTPDNPVTPDEPDEPIIVPDEPDEPIVVPDEPTPLVPSIPEESGAESEELVTISEETVPLAPSIPDEVIDDIIDEVVLLTSVPQTGAEEKTDDYAAAVPTGVFAIVVAALLKRKRRTN